MSFTPIESWYNYRRQSLLDSERSDRPVDQNLTVKSVASNPIQDKNPQSSIANIAANSESNNPVKRFNLRSALRKLWQSLTVPSSEPHVWKKGDRQGNIYWKVYDPLTDRSGLFESENQLRVWLEQRYSK